MKSKECLYGVKITNNASRRIKQILKNCKNLRKPLKIIAEEMRKDIRKNIDNEESFEGIKWGKSKSAKKRNGTTLKRTGRLYNSFTIYSDNNVARVGTNVKYAKVLNDGAKKGKLWRGSYSVKQHKRKVKYKKRNGEWAKKKKSILVKAHSRRGVAPWGDIKSYNFMGFSKRLNEKIVIILKKHILS